MKCYDDYTLRFLQGRVSNVSIMSSLKLNQGIHISQTYIYDCQLHWKSHHQCDMAHHSFLYALKMPILDLVPIYLLRSKTFDTMYWGQHNLSSPTCKTITDIMADYMVWLYNKGHVNDCNNLSIGSFGAASNYMKDNTTLQEFLYTGNKRMYDGFSNSFYKIVLLTF